MKKRFLFFVISVLIGGIVLTGGISSVSAAGDDAKYGGTLVRNHTGKPTNFGFPPSIHGPDAAYCSYSVEPLILPSSDNFGEFDPILAERWEVASDKLSYTFYLRKDVKFHDGTDFNAQAAKWNYDKLIEIGTSFLSKVTSIEAVDDHTLRFNLSSWDPLLLCDLSDTVCRLISPSAYKANGEKWCHTHPVGTGPWITSDFKHGEYVKYKKNPNYWDKEAKLYIDEMHFMHIMDPMTLMAEMLRGNIHSAVSDITFANQFKGKKEFNIDDIIPMHTLTLFLNATDPASIWSDVRMRHALEYAINKEEICRTIGRDIAEPRYEIIYPFSRFGKLAEPRKFDPDKARKLIAEAGHKDGVEVEMFLPDKFESDLLLAMMQNLADVGIKVKYSPLKGPTWWDKLKSPPDPGEFWMNPTMSNAPNPLFFALNLLAPSSPTVQGLKRPDGFDDLVAEAVTKVTISEQVPILEKAEKLLYEDAVYIPLWTNPTVNVNSKKVHGAQWFTFGQDKSNLNNAWIEK